MITSENIIQIINKHLQKKVDFTIDNKTIKSGKIILFSVKDFFCSFLLFSEQKNKRFLYEIPYPFHYSELNGNIIFDYTIDTFVKNNPSVKDELLKLKNKKQSKLFNKKLTLKIYI
jgi:hypothetical protein